MEAILVNRSSTQVPRALGGTVVIFSCCPNWSWIQVAQCPDANPFVERSAKPAAQALSTCDKWCISSLYIYSILFCWRVSVVRTGAESAADRWQWYHWLHETHETFRNISAHSVSSCLHGIWADPACSRRGWWPALVVHMEAGTRSVSHTAKHKMCNNCHLHPLALITFRSEIFFSKWVLASLRNAAISPSQILIPNYGRLASTRPVLRWSRAKHSHIIGLSKYCQCNAIQKPLDVGQAELKIAQADCQQTQACLMASLSQRLPNNAYQAYQCQTRSPPSRSLDQIGWGHPSVPGCLCNADAMPIQYWCHAAMLMKCLMG